MTPNTWTVIAHSRTPGKWVWAPHWTPGTAMDGSDRNEIIVMHRKAPDGWELVARLAGPRWRRWMQRRGR